MALESKKIIGKENEGITQEQAAASNEANHPRVAFSRYGDPLGDNCSKVDIRIQGLAHSSVEKADEGQK